MNLLKMGFVSVLKLNKSIKFNLKYFVIIFLFLFANLKLISQNFEQVQKIVKTSRSAFDEFGQSVSIYGDYAVVGVTGSDTDPGDDNGAAYVYKRDDNNNWALIKRLVPSDQQSYGYEAFGSSVDIYGDYIIVGSVYTATYYGGVYIYKKNQGGTDNWGEIKKIEASDANFNDFFGDSGISIYSDYIAVGATNEDQDAVGLNTLSNSGSVYIFKKDQGGTDNWGQIKKIVASDRAGSDFFGGAVSLYGDYLVVGANYEDEDESGLNTKTQAGSVYIFKKNQGGVDNWGQIKKIVPSDRNTNDEFGIYLDIYGDYIVVCAYFEDDDASGLNTLSNSGSVYIFKKNQGGTDNWGQIKKITAPIRELESYFGSSISIYNDYLVVGETNSSFDENNLNNLNDAGAAYIFKQNEGGADNWGLIKKIVSSDRASNDLFGYSVAINDNFVFSLAIGNDYDEDGNNIVNSAGAGYIFQILPILNTTTPNRILDKFAVSGGSFESFGNLTISQKGVIWSVNSNPTINLTTKTNSNSGTSDFSDEITSLLPNTLYYIRSYAITSKGGTSYGNELTFTTKKSINVDGNQDGIDDDLQNDAETILNPTTNTYITIESVDSDSLSEVGIIQPNDNKYFYPFGLISFKIKSSSAVVKLYFHGYSNLNEYEYRKILPNEKYFKLQNAVFSVETILENPTTVVTLTLEDGGIGDYDGIVNGVIHDPGGPAILASSVNIPSLSEWARIGLISSFVFFGVWWSKKKSLS